MWGQTFSLRPERSEEVPLGYPSVTEGEAKFAATRCNLTFEL